MSNDHTANGGRSSFLWLQTDSSLKASAARRCRPSQKPSPERTATGFDSSSWETENEPQGRTQYQHEDSMCHLHAEIN